MAQLIVRHLPEATKDRLKQRAKTNGRSMEAEAREILTQALSAGLPFPPPTGSARVKKLIERLRTIGTTNDDIDDMSASIAKLRQDQRMFDINR